MTITIEIPPSAEPFLSAEALRTGEKIETLIQKVLTGYASTKTSSHPVLSILDELAEGHQYPVLSDSALHRENMYE